MDVDPRGGDVVVVVVVVYLYSASRSASNALGCTPTPLKKMWGITYAIYPPSSRPTTGSWGGACNDTAKCNALHPLPIFLRQKILNLLSPHRFFQAQNAPKPVFGRGSVPDSAGGAYDAPPDALVGWGGGHPLSIPLPPRRLRRLDLAAIPPSSKRNLRQKKRAI